MNITPLQDSFNRGEISPKLYQRSDSEWYADSVQRLNNFITIPRGAAKRRTGFRYLGRVAIPDNTVNVFPQPTQVTITTPDVDVTIA